MSTGTPTDGWMEQSPWKPIERSVQAPKAHLPSLPAGRRPEQFTGSTTVDEVLVGELGRPPGDPGQPGQEDRRDRRGHVLTPTQRLPLAQPLSSMAGQHRSVGSGYPNPATTESGRLVFPPCEERANWSNWRSNPNGKPTSNPTATGFAQDARVTMRSKPF